MDLVEEALSSAEIKAEFRDNPGRLKSLRTELLDGEAELTGTVSAERKHWQDAAKRAANPRDAVQADKKDVKTPFYRFVFLPMLGVLVISFGSARSFACSSDTWSPARGPRSRPGGPRDGSRRQCAPERSSSIYSWPKATSHG